jgi:hypothetical protein
MIRWMTSTSSSLDWVQPSWSTGMNTIPASARMSVVSDARMTRCRSVSGMLVSRPS